MEDWNAKKQSSVEKYWLMPDGKTVDIHPDWGHLYPLYKRDYFPGKQINAGDKLLCECGAARVRMTRYGDLYVETGQRPTYEQVMALQNDIRNASFFQGDRFGCKDSGCSYKNDTPDNLTIQQFISRCW
jgi:hypothetical protein